MKGSQSYIFSAVVQMKTVSVALVLCLNVGVDPPDVVKISPCARLECWVGKFSNGLLIRVVILVRYCHNDRYLVF